MSYFFIRLNKLVLLIYVYSTRTESTETHLILLSAIHSPLIKKLAKVIIIIYTIYIEVNSKNNHRAISETIKTKLLRDVIGSKGHLLLQIEANPPKRSEDSPLSENIFTLSNVKIKVDQVFPCNW